jgi:hypothetical protein
VRTGEEIRILGFEYGFLNSFDEVCRYDVLDEVFSKSFLGVFRGIGNVFLIFSCCCFVGVAVQLS